MVKNTTCRAYEYVHASAQLSRLVLNWNTPVDSKHIVLFFGVFEQVELFGDLKSKFSGGRQYYALDLARAEALMFAQVLNHRERES